MSERTIFLNALDIADPAARQQFLDRECAGNEGLRREVDALLTAHNGAGEFLEKPAIPSPGSPVLAAAAAAAITSADPTVDGEHGRAPQDLKDRSPDSAKTQLFDEARGMDGFPFLPASHRADAIGRLSHYEILTPLGKGAFGSVFKAFDTRLDRIVAVKVLAPELAASGGARKRFIREAKSAASVRHEHVVDIHAVDEEPIPYLVMECIIGQTLQQKLDRSGPLTIVEILRIGYQIATGLSAAHALGLIHRDIKPANILLENGVERVKITDFGLARAGDDASLTQSGIVCGTPMYMAPEQAQGEALDGRADLFSLGSTLYAMCTGRPPFRATTTMAVLKRVVEDHPRPIREINPEIPEWLCEIVDKLLAKKPADRFQSAKEVAGLFSQHLAHLQHPQTPAPPRIGRLRAEPIAAATVMARSSHSDQQGEREADVEEQESGSTLLGSLLVFLPIFSLLAALLVAVRKGILGSLQEGPDDVAKGLMVLLGGLAASSGLFAWWFEGTTRRVASSLAIAAILLAMGEGFRLIRVGEPAPPAIVSVSESGTASAVNSARIRPTEDSAGGRIDLLAVERMRSADADSPAASIEGGTLTLKHSGGDKPVFLRLDEIPFRNGEIRLRAVCLSREPGFALSLGVGHFWEVSQRVDAALQAATAEEPVGLHLSHFDKTTRTMITAAIARCEPVEAGREVELRMQVRDGNVRVNAGSAVPVETKDELLPGRDVVPYLVCKGSSWKILEWTLKSEDAAGPVDLLNWGRFVNPTDLASLERAYDHAIVEVPGSRPFHLLPLPGYNLDAPRLMQEIEGDFEIAVAISPFERPLPGTDSRPGGQVSLRSAGLFVWQDDKTFARFEQSASGEQEQGAPCLHAEWYGDGQPRGEERGWLPEENGTTNPIMLRIHRWGSQLQLAWSRDGRTWNNWRIINNLSLGRRLQVGLFAQNSTNTPFKVRFDRFRLRGQELPDSSLARVPFDARRAAEWQAAAAKEAGVPVEYTNSVGMALRLIPAGEFTMGLAVEEINDVIKKRHQEGLDKGLMEFMTYASGPQHKVRLTKSYYVAATEVTVGQFRRFVEETKYKPTDKIAVTETPDWLKPSSEELDRRPATKVTWHEARKFCRWLSEKEGVEYALPTDAQWEFACRAGSPEKWPHGDDRDELKDYAWYDLGYHDAPRGVGLKKPNAFGLYDMLGNAHEWVQDWHQQGFYRESPILDPVCTQPGVGRVCRGGWWWDSADLIRSASRGYNVPDIRYPGCGFRVAILPPFGKLPKPVEPAAPAAGAANKEVSEATLSAPLDFSGSLIGAGGFFSLATTADGSRVIAGTFHGKIGIWNSMTREQIRVIDAHERSIHGLVVTPDQRHIVSAAEDGLICKWNLDSGEKVLQFVGHTGRVDSLAIVGESGRETLISATADFVRKAEYGIRAWDLATGEPRQQFTGDIGFIGCMAAVPGTERVVTCDFLHRRVTLWDVAKGTLLRFVPSDSLQSLAADPGGKTLVTGHAARKQADGRWDDPDAAVLQLRDVESLEPGRVFRGHRGPVNSVAFSPDGTLLVSVSGGAHGEDGSYLESADTSVRVWDVETGKELARRDSLDRLLRVAFLPGGKQFVTGGNDHLRLWEVR